MTIFDPDRSREKGHKKQPKQIFFRYFKGLMSLCFLIFIVSAEKSAITLTFVPL